MDDDIVFREKHYSPSQVKTWLKCSMAWAWRNVRKIVEPPGAALIVGKTVHVPAEAWHRRGIALGNDWTPEGARAALSLDEAESLAGDAFERFAMGKDDKYPDGPPVDWATQEEKKGAAKDRAVLLSRRYVEIVAPGTGRPLACEEEIALNPNGRDWTLVTRPDSVTTSGGIVILRDTKSAGKSPAGVKDGSVVVPADHRRQLAAYRYAWRSKTGANPDRAVVDYVWAGKGGANSVTAPADVNDADEGHFFHILDRMHDAITRGWFQRNPDSWSCNPRWCGYYERCWVNGEDI